ncbi:RecQ family ATP-dependent DNA helicase [Chloroflexota bacterium]
MAIEVICPRCGAPMVIRTARTGRNAGRDFYGCTNYFNTPQCRETLPLEEADPTSSIQPSPRSTPQQVRETLSLPHVLIARSRFQNHQVKFFETCAVPGSFLDYICASEIDEHQIQFLSQWRIDFPIKESIPVLETNQRQVISVLEKILTRGRVTLLSPQLEGTLKGTTIKNPDDSLSISINDVCLDSDDRASFNHNWLDSEEESVFYNRILRKGTNRNLNRFIIPQVEISSLLPMSSNTNSAQNQRVDFLINHPATEEKMIIEIDGEQHLTQIESDRERDAILQQYGYTVIRIPAEEIRREGGPQYSLLKSKLSIFEELPSTNLTPGHKKIINFIQKVKFAHQIQVAMLQAIQSGHLDLNTIDSWNIVTDIDKHNAFDKRTGIALLKKTVNDFVEVLRALCKLYSVKLENNGPECHLFSTKDNIPFDNSVCLAFSDGSIGNIPTFHMQNIYFSHHLTNSSFSAPPVTEQLVGVDEDILLYFLRYIFRMSSFREGQYEGINRILFGKDSMLLLPTGAGKSLVYQLASMLLSGRTIVIDPIIALMDDQIDNLAARGIGRCIAISSQIDNPQERERAIELFGQGEYLFAFVAPERFQTTKFRESLRALTVHTPITLIVVDEAHCVSEWGHDFRPAYLNIGRTTRDYCQFDTFIPPLIALTGTASRAVLKDVLRELQIIDFDAIITPASFNRPELHFKILHSTSDEKVAKLNGYLSQSLPNLLNITSTSLYQSRGKDTYAGLVFCPHVNGEYGVVQIKQEIQDNLGIGVQIYSGSAPNNWNANEYRLAKYRTATAYKRNAFPILVSTNAFGMGIDKQNIRYTIHYCLPHSIESFYQEAGRAGRDGNNSYCCVIFSDDDVQRSQNLLNPNTTVEEIDGINKSLSRVEGDDITRALFFHTGAFRGVQQEKQDCGAVIQSMGDTSRKGAVVFSMPQVDMKIVEKALHRLLIIGLILDYTVDYSKKEFSVKLSGANNEEIAEAYGNYVAGYLLSRRETELEKIYPKLSISHIDFVSSVIDLLLNFVYDVIERGRRRALNEMLATCTQSTTDEDVRDRILKYFAGEYSETLENILLGEDAGIIECRDVFSSIRSPNDAAELRGQVSRYLESYPDHPALLMLRCLCELFSRDSDSEVAKQNFTASVSAARTSYGINDSSITEFAIWAISNILNRDGELTLDLVSELIELIPSRECARKLVQELPSELTKIPEQFLIKILINNCITLIPINGGNK